MSAPLLHLVCLLALQAGPPAESPRYEPESAYERRSIEGWSVLVHRSLLNEHRDLGQRALKLLAVKLYDITQVVPAGPLAELRKTPIWVERDNTRHNPCACYHVSEQWLQANGFNPIKARSVEICNAETFIDWSRTQPWMVLHELAHAYHDRVLGYDDRRIREAHAAAAASGAYNAVLRNNGRRDRHYALRTPQEYFAELSECYFGVNDFYPFIRAELAEHDPAGLRLMELIWGGAASPEGAGR